MFFTYNLIHPCLSFSYIIQKRVGGSHHSAEVPFTHKLSAEAYEQRTKREQSPVCLWFAEQMMAAQRSTKRSSAAGVFENTPHRRSLPVAMNEWAPGPCPISAPSHGQQAAANTDAPLCVRSPGVSRSTVAVCTRTLPSQWPSRLGTLLCMADCCGRGKERTGTKRTRRGGRVGGGSGSW